MNNSEMSAETAADKSGVDDNTKSSHSSANTMLPAALSIDDGNKLIAKFMHKNFRDTNRIIAGRLPSLPSLKYHSSWQWLMPVLEKIRSLNFKTNNGEKILIRTVITIVDDKWNGCKIESFGIGHNLVPQIIKINDDLLKATREAIVEFINWYNEIVPVSER